MSRCGKRYLCRWAAVHRSTGSFISYQGKVLVGTWPEWRDMFGALNLIGDWRHGEPGELPHKMITISDWLRVQGISRRASSTDVRYSETDSSEGKS